VNATAIATWQLLGALLPGSIAFCFLPSVLPANGPEQLPFPLVFSASAVFCHFYALFYAID